MEGSVWSIKQKERWATQTQPTEPLYIALFVSNLFYLNVFYFFVDVEKNGWLEYVVFITPCFFSSGELFNAVETDTFNSSTKVSIGGNGLSYPSTCLYHSEQHHGLWNFNKYMKFYIVWLDYNHDWHNF